MDIARQRSRLQQFVRQIKIEIIPGDHVAERLHQVRLGGPVNHGELVAQLAIGPGGIKHPQRMFPEATPHRQDRIILGKPVGILTSVAN